MKKRFGIVTIFIILLFGTILAGCNPDYSSLSLTLNVNKIEMAITDEKADYYITVDNYYDFNAEFDFSFAKAVARVDSESVEYKGEGVFKFSVTPLVAESSTLTITLKGLNKPITVPVVITRAVTGITAHESLFVVRGSNLKLNSSMFTFEPGDTNLKGLTYEFPLEYAEEYASNGITLSEDFVLSAPQDCPYDSIFVTATSTYDANVSVTFEILAINNINTTNFALKIASQDKTDPNVFGGYSESVLHTVEKDGEIFLSLDGENPYVLDLVISDNAGFQKKLAVEYDLWSKGYATNVSADENLLLGGNTGDILSKTQNFDFVLSAEDVCEGKISFRVYQLNLSQNHAIVNLYVKATSKPRQIAVNGQVSAGLVELYTNSTEVKEFNFSVVPIKANKNQFNYVMSFYSVNEMNDELLISENQLSSTPTDYISVYYGGAKLVLDPATKLAVLDEFSTEKLASSLTLQAKQTTGNKYIAIKLDCIEGETVIAGAVMYVKVYVGTTKFEINDAYKNNTIYLSLTGGKQTFNGLNVDTGATAGKLTISSSGIGESICDIEQPSTSSCALEITPKQVGSQEFVITTANNLSVVLTVVVIRQVSQNDFSLSLKESESEAVASYSINADTNSLESVVVKGIGSTVKLVANVSGYTDVDSNSYSYNLYFTEGVGDTYFDIAENSIISSLQFTKIYQAMTNSYVEYPVPLFVDLIMYEIVDFVRVEQDIDDNLFTIIFECVNYIKELSLYASENAGGETKEKTVSIYNKGDLSYVNQNLATVYLYMDLVQSTQEDFTNYNYSNFTVYFNGLTTGAGTPDLTTGQIKRNSEVIGTLNLHSGGSANGYLGSLTYDYSGIVAINSIRIVFSVTDIYTNVTFSSAVVVNVEDYIDVDSLWLNSPQSVIYLDDTATYQKTSISVQVLPANAMCSELDVLVETNQAGCIKVDNDPDTNILTFTYQSAGSGKIYIFPKSKMKTQSYYDEYGNMYYHLELDFVCADGKTETTALKISTYEDLRRIVPTKHYYIDSSIDCKGNVLDLATFNGTLRGTFLYEAHDDFATCEQIGSIINFKVSTNGTANIGLFRALNENAKIYNVSFSGSFDNPIKYNEETKLDEHVGLQLSETSYIGLVCGVNFGTIKNVTATVNQTCSTTISNVSTGEIQVYAGLLAGANLATGDGKGIYVTQNCKNYTLLANNTAGTTVTLNFVKGSGATAMTSYFGGIVGRNLSVISQQTAQDFVTIGLYGITSNVYATTNADYIGGVVGENAGTITGLKALGVIKSDKTNTTNQLAGFVGSLVGGVVKNNISRVYVSGYGTVNGFAGKVDAYVSNSDDNNLVQAIDDGTKVGIEASIIVGIGDASIVNSISATALAGVKAETYIDRSYPTAVTSIYNNQKEITFATVDKIATDSTLSKENYYGDIVKLHDDDTQTLAYVNMFTKATSADFNTNYIKTFVLPAFKQAVLKEQQSNVSNAIDSLSLLKFARIGSNDGVTFEINDITIVLQSANLATLENYGKAINLNGVGNLQIQVVSSLNYKKYVSFNVYVTNYYESVRIYDSKDKLEEVGTIILLNSKTTNIYFDCYSTSYNYLNTPISLVSNSEATFNYYYQDSDTQDLVQTEIHGQVGYLNTRGEATTFEGEIINFVTKFVYGTTEYFRYSKLEETATGSGVYKNVVYYGNGLYTNAYVSLDDLSNNSLGFGVSNSNAGELETTGKQIDAVKGIDEIKLSKSVVEAEPTDSIEVIVTYVSYDNTKLGEVYVNNDILEPTLKVYESYAENIFATYGLSDDGTFKGTSGVLLDKTLFTLESKEAVVQNLIYATGSTTEVVAVKYTQYYVLKMPVDSDFDIDVYNYLKDKQIELVFTATVAESQSAGMLVKYTPESITSVLVNNYNKNSNSNMVVTEGGITKVYADNVIYSGKQSAIGEINLLNAYVYTRLSEFDYVDITMNLGTEGGYIAFVEYEYEDTEKVGRISNNSVYTSITNGATLRIYKQYIKDDALSNTLLISVVYKIPKTVADGTYIPFEFKFYDDGVVSYSTQINLLAKMENQVSFEINEKEPLEVNDDVQVYQVARGMKYLLNTTIIGYTHEQAVFESSSPSVANISYEGGDYYLNITPNAINYDGAEYFTVTINSYGQKLEQNKLQTSMIKSTEIRIFEYLVNATNLFAGDNRIAIRMKQTIDIREVIANKISFEYSKNLASTLKDFKESYMENAKFVLVDKFGIEYDLSYSDEKVGANGVWFKQEFTDLYKVECFKDLTTGELHYNFTPLNIGQPCEYSFKVYHNITYFEGKPTSNKITDETVNIYSQEFAVNAYVASSESNATPIYDYQDMLEMLDGEYYRQVSDITIKASEFQMITASPAMFDGNGYTITITSGAISVSLDNSSDFALFKNINEDCVLKNVSIVVSGNLAMTLNNSLNVSGANIAILVAENSGIITNCSIKSSSVVSADIISTVSVMEKSYFAGLCALNSGYITNCQIECNLTANGASLGGVVAENSGDIASTYIKNSRLYNTSSTTNENIVSGGFACRNSGTVNMCYIEGSASGSRIYSEYPEGDYTLTSKIIYTATKVAGFVYENTGNVIDSYSNIPIVCTNMCSGFVGVENGGTLQRVFSLCKLKSNDTLNYGFVISYNEEKSTFDDCFFVIDQNIINFNTSETNYTATQNGSTVVYSEKITGVTPLAVQDFNVVNKDGTVKQNTPFAHFITDSTKEHGVWFYAYDADKENLPSLSLAVKTTYACEVSGITNAEGKAQTFKARSLQLVSPNIIAFSQYDLALSSDSEYAEHTYLLSSKADAVGTKTNPYIITSATEFEDYCNQHDANNYEYYRLVCDINFADEGIYTTGLYNKTLIGYFDGNGFDISAYAVNSITSNLSAGLFGQIGKQNAEFSCIKNVNFAPTYINLPNSIFVGGVAGSLVNANAYNVSIVGADVVIVGRNVVGGLFGRTYGETSLNSVYANITAKASKYNAVALKTNEAVDVVIEHICYNENGANKTDVSYAGAVVGYAGGVSTIVNAEIGAEARTQGMTAGLMFGGIGSISTVNDITLQLDSHVNQVVAYAFGGLIAGENKGTIQNVELNSNILGVNTFVCEPITPIAVGGVAGLSIGGKVTQLTSTQGYSIIAAEILNTDNDMLNPHNPYVAKYVGGIYGYAKVAEISDVKIGNYDGMGNLIQETKDEIGLVIMGGNYVGGLVGFIQDTIVKVENNSLVADDALGIYMLNTRISNNKVNLISQKTYIDAEEQQVTHGTYFSYVNMAVGNSNQVVTNEHKIGLVYGGATNNEGDYTLKLLNRQYEDETTNSITRGQPIVTYHGEYNLCSINENHNEATTGEGQNNNIVYTFLTKSQGMFYNTYGTSELTYEVTSYNPIAVNLATIDSHENMYVKIVDLKTSKYTYALWADWAKK